MWRRQFAHSKKKNKKKKTQALVWFLQSVSQLIRFSSLFATCINEVICLRILQPSCSQAPWKLESWFTHDMGSACCCWEGFPLLAVACTERYERLIYLIGELQKMLIDVESFGSERTELWWILTFSLLMKLTEKLDTAHTKNIDFKVCDLGKTGNVACHEKKLRAAADFSYQMKSYSTVLFSCTARLPKTPRSLTYTHTAIRVLSSGWQ